MLLPNLSVIIEPFMIPEQYRERGPRTGSVITAASFPLPHRVNTFNENPQDDRAGLGVVRLRDIAQLQAVEANYMFDRLTQVHQERCQLTPTLWRNLYRDTIMWRYLLAQQTGGYSFGNGITVAPERIMVPITDDSPNIDRVGKNGRLKASPSWDEDRQIWIGGTPTPASRNSEYLGELARARFEFERNKSDVLQNIVHLPDRRIINGNRIVRGNTAKEIVTDQVAQMVSERGREVVRQIDTEVDNTMLCINGTAADRKTIFSAAMDLLSRQTPGLTDDNTLANIAYLLYQSPQTKRGSDAVIRTYFVAAGTFLTGTPPIIPQDIDLRAYIMGQQKFIDYFTTHSA